MTKREYASYERRVAAFFANGLQNLSVKTDEERQECSEPYFSWQRCDCCGSSLGGDRYDCDGWNATTEEIEEHSVCPDCVYYAEYGRLDDATMDEIDSEPAEGE